MEEEDADRAGGTMINVTHTLIDGVLFMDVQTDLGAQRYAMEISKGQIEFNQTKQ